MLKERTYTIVKHTLNTFSAMIPLLIRDTSRAPIGEQAEEGGKSIIPFQWRLFTGNSLSTAYATWLLSKCYMWLFHPKSIVLLQIKLIFIVLLFFHLRGCFFSFFFRITTKELIYFQTSCRVFRYHPWIGPYVYDRRWRTCSLLNRKKHNLNPMEYDICRRI